MVPPDEAPTIFLLAHENALEDDDKDNTTGIK